MKKNIFAMTLVELVIAITISSIVLLFVVVYISDVLWLIWESRKATSNFVELQEISQTLQDLKYKYPVATIDSSTGEEILLLKNIENTDWVAIWIVQSDTKQLSTTAEIQNYWQKFLARRFLLSTEISFDSNISFSGSEFFPNISVKDVDFEIYDFASGSLVEMNLEYLKNYSAQREWENIWDMSVQNFQNYSFSF